MNNLFMQKGIIRFQTKLCALLIDQLEFDKDFWEYYFLIGSLVTFATLRTGGKFNTYQEPRCT